MYDRPTMLFMNSPNCFVCIEQLDDPYQMQIVIPKKDTRGLQQRTADDDRTISFQRPVSQGESSPCFKKSIKKKKNKKKHICQLVLQLTTLQTKDYQRELFFQFFGLGHTNWKLKCFVEFKVQSNLAIRNFLVALKLYLNSKSSLFL